MSKCPCKLHSLCWLNVIQVISTNHIYLTCACFSLSLWPTDFSQLSQRSAPSPSSTQALFSHNQSTLLSWWKNPRVLHGDDSNAPASLCRQMSCSQGQLNVFFLSTALKARRVSPLSIPCCLFVCLPRFCFVFSPPHLLLARRILYCLRFVCS